MHVAPGLTLTRHAIGSRQHRDDLAVLAQRGVPLPHPCLAVRADPNGSWFRVVSGEQLLTGMVVSEQRSRAVPGARLLRMERAGRALHAPLEEQFGAVCKGIAESYSGVLQFNVELFDESAPRRHAFAHSLAAAGFERVPARSYTRTLVLPLGASATALFDRLSKSTRRNIRQAQRHGLHVQPVTTPQQLEQCRLLYAEAFRRTGQRAPVTDFGRMLASAAGPHACLLGVFLPPDQGESGKLVAFAWVRSHGDYASYDTAGSARHPSVKSVTPGDLLMMACIEWAVEHGHAWFELGGVSSPAPGTNDPLRGISDFKRGFSQEVLEVGEEWRLRPNAVLSAIGDSLQRVRAVARSLVD